MQYMRRRVFAGLAASALLLTALPALASDWEVLGTSNVNLKKNFTLVHVGAREGLFKRIQIKVADERIVIESLEVTYSNGDKETLNVRATIPAGGETRVLDLPGGAIHAIRTIRIQHERIPTGGTAVVTILGREV